jgi:hygromycin-B 4-O-kinase
MVRPDLSPDTVSSLVAASFSGEPVTLRPLPEGEESRAFWFRHGDGEYVVRVRFSSAGFEKERFVAERWALPGVRIPAVLTVAETNGYSVCVTEQLPGWTLQDTEPELLPRLVGPAANVLEEIHGSDLSGTMGFGLFDADGYGSHASWRDWLLDLPDGSADSLDKGLLEEVQARYLALMEFCPEERSLLHGDYGSNNVLTDGREITGVLDWENAMFGDPLFDMVGCYFWRTRLPCMEVQARYYETLPEKPPHYDERVACYALRVGLDEVYANLRDGDEEMAAWALRRCAGMLGL